MNILDGANGNGNRKGISIEICYSKSGGSKYTQAEENAVYVCARLLNQFSLGIDALKQHADFANKNCPHRIRDEKRWDSFKERVNTVLKAIKNGTCDSALSSGTTKVNGSSSSSSNSSSSSTSFKVGDKVKVKTSATHYATGQSMASFVKGSTYEVTKIDGNKLLLSDIASWVWDYDVDKVSTSSSSSTKEFKVKIICNSLNVREKADFNSKVVTTVSNGEVFTIVEESNGLGLLKSYKNKRNGWISMGEKYVKKL